MTKTKWYYRFPLKAAAFVLAVLCCLGAAGGAVAAAVFADNDVFTTDETTATHDLLRNMLRSRAGGVAYYSRFDAGGAQAAYDGTNLRFRVSLNGFLLEENAGGAPASISYTYTETIEKAVNASVYTIRSLAMYPGIARLGDQLEALERHLVSRGALHDSGIHDWDPDWYVYRDETVDSTELTEAVDRGDAPMPDADEEVYDANGLLNADIPVANLAPLRLTVQVWLPEELVPGDIFYNAQQAMHLIYVLRDMLPVLIAVSGLLGLVLVLYLFCAAGHRANTDVVVLGPLGRIPYDIFLAMAAALLIPAGAMFIYLADIALHQINFFCAMLTAALAVVMAAVLLGVLLNTAARAKAGGLFKNTLIWRILAFIGRMLANVGRGVAYLVRGLPILWKTVLVLGALVLLDFIITVNSMWSIDALMLWWLASRALLIPAALVYALNLHQLQRTVQNMAAGALDAPVDTRYLVGDFKRGGEDLGRIREGMSQAVAQQLKSERLKTELITNVSHDIKTPLTSIINYVDLIKKEQPENETVCQYIEVLDRQSARLKKLIEDLIEASKASSGALTTHPEPCTLGVLLQQMTGEYAERLEAAGLTPVLEEDPDEPLTVMADGRHMWRIFDNLLGNICKYAQSGTRVYMSVRRMEQNAVVTFRNISQAALNIPGEELLERFVRGDRSRHTEGSGLGLSIARSLAELQGGRLDLDIDGDLFKVTLTFPALPPQPPQPSQD